MCLVCGACRPSAGRTSLKRVGEHAFLCSFYVRENTVIEASSPTYTIYATLIVARGRRHSRRKVDQAGHAPVLRLERRQSLLELDLLELEARARCRDQRAAEGVAAR